MSTVALLQMWTTHGTFFFSGSVIIKHYNMKKKMSRSESARKAATMRWARLSKKERSKILSKISSLGGKARWKVIHTADNRTA